MFAIKGGERNGGYELDARRQETSKSESDILTVLPDQQDERVPLWSVSRQWRRHFLALFTAIASLMTALIVWHEIWVRDSDTLMETILGVTGAASGSYLAIAVGTAVFVDVLTFSKTVLQNAKKVITLLTEILKDALKRHEERRKEEGERRERERRMQEEIESLKQQNKELEEKLKQKAPNS